MVSFPPEKSLGYQIRITHRAIDRLLTTRLADYDLKAGYWYYLRVLWLEEGLTQKKLGDLINVKENTTVAMILAMESDGLVVRKRDERDRRKMCVYLTEKGRNLESELMPVVGEIIDLFSKGIDQRDVDTCLSVLERIRGNLAEFADD